LRFARAHGKKGGTEGLKIEQLPGSLAAEIAETWKRRWSSFGAAPALLRLRHWCIHARQDCRRSGTRKACNIRLTTLEIQASYAVMEDDLFCR